MDSIKGLGHINFDSHKTMFEFGGSGGVYNLMSYNDIVRNLSLCYKGRLHGRNDFRKQRFEAIG